MLIGDFNRWKPEPMVRDRRGLWMLSKRLPGGTRYRYDFLVDKRVVADPWNRRRVRQNGWVYSILELPSARGAPEPIAFSPVEPPILRSEEHTSELQSLA